jgi:hypothetical protein
MLGGKQLVTGCPRETASVPGPVTDPPLDRWRPFRELLATSMNRGAIMCGVAAFVVACGSRSGLFDRSNWAILPLRNSPSPRTAASAAGLPGRIVLFGGCDGINGFSDTWQFDGTSWTKLDAAGPTRRWDAAIGAW